MKLSEIQTALVVGTFVAVMHVIWSSLVFLGLAGPYLNWILGLHFLNNPFTVQPFSFGTALVLVGFTFVVGYLLGYVFAIIWNRLHKK